MPVTIQAPTGAHFDMGTVKTAKGTVDLGEVPILVWDDVDAAISHYGKDGIADILDGTSLRVSFQAIARRAKAKNQTDDQIAEAEIAFRPGKRAVGVSTPASRAKNAASAAASKVDGDVVAALLKKIASGELSEADIKSLTS